MTDLWPIHVLTPRNLARSYTPRTLAGTTALSGFTQAIVSPAAGWRIKYENIAVRTAAQINTWDALEAILEGRATPILVPLCEGRRRPFSDPEAPPVPHDDETPFDDGTGYDQPSIVAKFTADAALRATEVSLTVIQGGTLTAGHHFSVGERLYRIQRIVTQDGASYTIKIRPGLREAVLDGDEANFERLWCKCRLASDNEMALTLEMMKRGFGTVNFIEDPT